MLIRSISFEKQSLQNRVLLKILKKKDIKTKGDSSFNLEEIFMSQKQENISKIKFLKIV